MKLVVSGTTRPLEKSPSPGPSEIVRVVISMHVPRVCQDSFQAWSDAIAGEGAPLTYRSQQLRILRVARFFFNARRKKCSVDVHELHAL